MMIKSNPRFLTGNFLCCVTALLLLAIHSFGGTLDQDRLAWYKFNETSGTTTVNTLGSAGNATLGSSPATPAWSSGALSFDGVDDYVQTPVKNGSTRTLAAWIYPKSSDPVWSIESVFDCDVPGNYGSGWGLNNLFIYVMLDDTVWNSGVMITRNQWQHVCVTFDSTTVRVYLNGVLKSTHTYTQGPVTTTATYKIGRSNANDLFFHGDIKDAKIYSRLVTDQEVLTIQSSEAVVPDTAPTGLTATGSAGCVSLSWTAANDGETWYTVRRATTSGGPYTALNSTVVGTTFADTTATNGTTYYYVVAAANLAGTGPNSTEAGTSPAAGVSYYVDPDGNDGNNGTNEATPWKSISKVNATTFKGGDQILFKRGGAWTGTLSPQGSGTIAAQITLGSYGTGAKPYIDGSGAGAAIAIHSQSYWTIDGFEVTNFAGGAGGARCGIRVGGGGDGSTIRKIRILNNDVHDIQATPNVNDGARNWGGIFVWIDEPGRADDVLIQGNTVTEIQGQGISFWGEYDNNYNDYTSMNYSNCSPNVVVRGNRVWRTSGDGILTIGTDNELVEYNEVAYAGVLSGLYNAIAAAWPSRHRDGIWQYNHVHHTKWLEANDSTAFDSDGYVYGTTYFQYNYTHDNEGGFNMEYYWTWDYGLTVSRYNLSVNDGRGTYARVYFSNRAGSLLYNNIFYNPGMQLDVSNGGANTTNFYNNIFVGASRSASFDSQGVFYNNHFFGGVTATDTANGNVTQDPKFVDPNVIHNLAGFILQASSPCRNAGQVMSGNGSKDFWGVALPTTAPHRGASQINNSSGYAATPSYVKVSGPFSVVVPMSGGAAAAFTANVHDQNFRPMTAPPVTWSISPTVAGCSINSTGQVTLSSAAAGQRFAVTAISDTGTHTFSFSATAPVWTNSAGTGIWNTTDANWSGITWADGGDATFAHTSSAQSITISGSRSADEVKIGNRTNNANYTFTGGSLTSGSFTLQGETSTGPTVSETNFASTTVTVAGRADIGRARLIASGNTMLTTDTIGSSGTGGLGDWGFLRIQDNAIVTANNGITGNTTAWGLELNGGTLITKSLWAAPWTSSARMVFNGTLVKATETNPTFISLQASADSSPVIESGGAKFDTNGYDIGIGVALVGSGPLTKSGAGTLTLSGGWNYTGATSILGGTLVSGAAAGTSNSLYELTLSGGTLAALNPGSETLGNYQLRRDVVVGGSAASIISADVRVVANETRTFTVAPTGDPSGIDLLVSGKFGHHNGAAWGFATKAGEGVMKISGVNEIGSLTVNAGTLILENAGIAGMGNGGLVNNAQTEFSVTGSDSVSFSQAIQGSGSITKTGTGTLVLSGTKSYTGNTTVQAGTLGLGAASLADTSTVSIASAAKLELNFSGSDTVAALYINGVQQARGTWTATRDATHFAGTGSLVVTSGPEPVGNGTWTSTSDGNWSSVGNWQNTLPANGADFTATFSQSSASTITVDAGRTIGNLSFASGNTILAGSSALTLDVTSSSPQISVASGVTATITAPLTGNDGLAKSGPGTLVLSSSNLYTGGTTINGGTLAVSAIAAPLRHFDASSLALANSAGVSSWTDLSGNATSATVPSGNGTPTYLADAGTGTGLGAVNFIGNTSANDSQALKFARTADVRSVVSVFKGSSFLMTDSETYALHRSTDTNPADPLLQDYGQINYLGTVRVNSAAVADPKSSAMPTDSHNGFNLIALVGNGTPFTLDSFNKDRSYHSGNQLHAETILFNTVIDDTRRSQIEAYLTKKWFGTGAGTGDLLPTSTVMTLSNGGVLDLSGVNHQTLAGLDSTDGLGSSVRLGAASLTIANSAANTFDGNISGKGTLVKDGSGTLTLTASNSYTGTTLVSGGTLLVNGSTSAQSALTVINQAILGGTGNIGGTITVNTGGTVAPGASVGTLAAGSAIIGGTLAIEISGSSADRLNVAGNLNITHATLAISGSLTAPEYVIASYGSLTGTVFPTITGLPAGYGVNYSSNQIRIVANPTFASWIEVNYPTLADKTPTGDPDNDGMENALEYVLGGNPSLSDTGLAPTIATSGSNLVFTFDRADASETADIILVVQASTDLKTWPETYAVSTTTALSSSGVVIEENDTSPDTVTVTIPQGNTTAKFVRLRVTVTP